MVVRTKRVYEPAAKSDIAPSTALRQWFGHDPEKWPEFRQRYQDELAANPESVAQLVALAKQRTVTLVYGAKDPAHNHVLVLKEYLQKSLVP